jgi:5,10-methenyltetrahydrofolate synthetase
MNRVTGLSRADLRSSMIAAREAIPPSEHAAASAAIERHLDRLLAQLAPKLVGFFWPYRGEFDCRPLMRRRARDGGAAALPVIAAARAPMSFREWTPDSDMVDGRYGIPIPAAGITVTPDVLLMPVNAFDEQGFRLGYGGGYFDRTLAALRPQPVAVGIGFELARVASIFPGPFDLPMDYVVTEAGIHIRGGDGRLRLDQPLSA